MKQTTRLLALLLSLALCLACFGSSAGAAASGREAALAFGADSDLRDPASGLSPALSRGGSAAPAPEDPVRVIVRLEAAPAAAVSASARAAAGLRVQTQQRELRRALAAAGVPCRELYAYDTLLNALALELAWEDLETLAAMPGVRDVHLANRYAAPESLPEEGFNEATGADWMHDSGLDGSGTVIAVLGTGVTASHEAFGVYEGMLEQPKLTQAAARQTILELGRGAWISQKIPFAYDYADRDEDANDDLYGSGTHAAAIAAGYARAEDGALRFCGAAPDAQLLSMKVFSSQGDGGSDSAVCLRALEDAWRLGADVVCLALGEPEGLDRDPALESEVLGEVFGLLREKGVAVAAAAGDGGSMALGSSAWAGPGAVPADYADYGVLRTPADEAGVLSVAAAQSPSYPVRVLECEGRMIRFLDGGSGFFEALRPKEGGRAEYLPVPGFGTEADYKGLPVEGRIALVERGGISLEEKLQNAAWAGAVGLLVYNDAPGAFTPEPALGPIPVAAISREDGQWLLEHCDAVSFADPGDGGEEDDSGEDLGYYVRLRQGGELYFGTRCLIVSEERALALDLSVPVVNGPGNYLACEPAGGWLRETPQLRLASLMYEGSCLRCMGGFLGCSGEADEIQLLDSPEDLEISVAEDGSAQIQDLNCKLRWDGAAECFRFLRPGNPALEDSAARVYLYRWTREPPAAYELGTIGFPAEPLTVENPEAGQICGFSARGASSALELKPSLTGVGGSVRSAAANTDSDYLTQSGSAMAAANVSGGMACLLERLKQTRPELTAPERLELCEALLLSSARILTDEDGALYSPRSQGAGLMDLRAAAEARALITQPLLSLGESEAGRFTLRFTLRNLSDTALSYRAELSALRDLALRLIPEGREEERVYNSLRSGSVSDEIRVLGPRTLVVPAGESLEAELELQLSDELLAALREDFPNGAWLDGYVSLAPPEHVCDGGASCPGSQFTDMPRPGSWAHPGIDFVLRRGLFGGASATRFKPNGAMTRAMTVTVLYALAGRPEPRGENPFLDVGPEKYYTKAVTWAAENGIVTGAGPTRFNPGGDVTREQFAMILYHYAQLAGADTSARASLEDYPDLDRLHGYAEDAVSWAVASGILSGVKSGDRTLLNPRGNATRAQVATMFMRFICNCLEDPALRSELHASFTGFVGSWTQGPVLETHDWREIVELDHAAQALEGVGYLELADFELVTDVNRAWMVNGDDLNNQIFTGGWLGDNLWAETAYDPARCAINPQGEYDVLCAEPMLLREARRMIVTVTDAETGELYCVRDLAELPKARWNAGYGQWESSLRFLYGGTDRNGAPLPGGTALNVRFYAEPCWGESVLEGLDYEALGEQGKERLVWEFPLRIDDRAPEIEALRYDPAARTLSFTMSDESWLARAALRAVVELDEFGEPVAPADTDWSQGCGDPAPGASHSFTVADVKPGQYELTATDYAGNETRYHLALAASSKLHELHFVYPEDMLLPQTDRWIAGEGAAMTLPGLQDTRITERSFKGWLSEPLEGIWDYDSLAEAALDEEICWEGQSREIYGESWFYAFFSLPMEYGDARERLSRCPVNPVDFSQPFALGATDPDQPEQGFFLDVDGVSCPYILETDPDPSLAEPDPSLLFTLQPQADGRFAILCPDGTWLSSAEGELSWETEARGDWRLDYSYDFGGPCLSRGEGPEERVLCFDLQEDCFRMIPAGETESPRWRFSLFGPEPLRWGYTTAQD